MKKTKFFEELKSILNQNIVYTFLLLASIASFAWMMVMEIPEAYRVIRWCPFIYVVTLVLFVRAEKLIGIGSMTICVLYFVKLCIDPVTSVLGHFFSIVDTDIVTRNWNQACFFLSLEWIIIAFTLWCRSPVYIKRLKRKSDIKINSKHGPIMFFGFFLSVLSLGIYIGFPTIRNLLFFIWQEDSSSLAANSGPFLYLFKIFFELGKPIFLFWLYWKIDLIRKNYIRRTLQLLLIGFTFVLMSDYRILSILEATTMLLLFFMKKHGNKKQKNIFIKVLFAVVAIYGVFMLTTQNDIRNKSLVNLCRLMDIYTGGFMVATAGLNVQLENGITMFFHDIFNGSYILVGIFGRMFSTTDAINAAINASAKGTFFESIIQARAMFGPFYPIAIGLVADFVIRMDYHSAKTEDTLYKLVFVMCGFSTAVFMLMYTYTMIINFIVYKAMVWLMFVWLDKRIRPLYNKRIRI